MSIIAKETWIDIKGQEGKYQISNKLRVKRLARSTQFGKRLKILSERICTIHVATNGYSEIRFGQHKAKYMHRLVAETFIPNPFNYPVINHKNGVKTDYNIENLEWCTYQQNIIHAFKNKLITGKQLFGKDNPSCKISIDVVNSIKSLKGKQKLKETANQFNISVSHVWQLKNNKNRLVK